MTSALVAVSAAAAVAGPSPTTPKTTPSVVCSTGQPGTYQVERQPKRRPSRWCLIAERGGDGVQLTALLWNHWTSANAQGKGEMCAGPAGCLAISIHLGRPRFINSCDGEIFSQTRIHVKGTERLQRRPQPLVNTCRPRHPG